MLFRRSFVGVPALAAAAPTPAHGHTPPPLKSRDVRDGRFVK